MDTDWTFSSCSWLWEEDVTFKNSCSGPYWTKEEDKTFENALAVYHDDADRWDKIAAAIPGKTVEDVKLQYESLNADVAAIESGKVPLPHYLSNVTGQRKKKSSRSGVQRGIPWTEEEHRRFLQGLEKFGRGDWKSISRHCVLTKSNSQVASHAQKYFKRLNSVDKEGKRPSINDIRSVHPPDETTSADLENPTVNNMPAHPNEASNSANKQLLTPIYPNEASTSAGKQLLPPIYPNETMLPELPDLPVCSMFINSSFASEPIQKPGPNSVGMPTYHHHHHHATAPLVQESAMYRYGSFDVPSTSEIVDLDMFVLPHFLD